MESPLQCLPRTMSELSPAPSASSKDDVLQRRTKESCTGPRGVKDLPQKRTRVVFSFVIQPRLKFLRQQF